MFKIDKINKVKFTKDDFLDQISFLSKLNLENKENSRIITDYYLDIFSKSPEGFNDFILFLKDYITTFNRKDREKIASLYLDIFSFLCERFWLYENKRLLDDLCFSIIHPKEYNRINYELLEYKFSSEDTINKINDLFQKEVNKLNIKATIKWRYKNIYSIFKKCKKKKIIDVLKLKDIYAFRIVLKENSIDKCYSVLNLLHDSFLPIPSRFKDYILIPKINWYQSLHTSLVKVLSDFELPIEVQIRNTYMDFIAEYWVAAHYLYWKEKKSSLVDIKEKKLYEHITSFSLSGERNDIFCLTPTGDIVVLDQKSNIIDFANKIHKDIIKEAKYAIVNWQKQNLSYKVKNWDTIYIIK